MTPGMTDGRCEVSRSIALRPKRSLAKKLSPEPPMDSRTLFSLMRASATIASNARTARQVVMIKKSIILITSRRPDAIGTAITSCRMLMDLSRAI